MEEQRMPTNMHADILAALHGLAAAFNARDIDRVMQFFASDCSLDMPRGKESHGQGFRALIR